MSVLICFLFASEVFGRNFEFGVEKVWMLNVECWEIENWASSDREAAYLDVCFLVLQM